MKLAGLRLAALLLFVASPLWAGRSFNGSSDYIPVPSTGNALDISSGSTTWSLWFYPTTIPASGSHSIASNFASNSTGQFIFGFGLCGGVCSSNGQVGFLIGNYGEETGIYGACGTYTANKWYRMTVVVDSSFGSATMTVTGGTSCTTSVGYREQRTAGTGLFEIGAQDEGSFYQGNVAEFAVWHQALSAGQVAALSTICPIGPSANRAGFPVPVGYFPLYGASGSLIEPDLSGNANNGTLIGTSPANHPPCTP
jgi:hypothetical protein